MIRVEAEALPDGLPGHARILLTGTPLPAGSVTLQLRREGYSAGFLGRGGWQPTEETLAPLDVVAVEELGGWAIVLGPEVSRHMTEAPYQLRLPHLNQDFGIFWPGIEEFVPGTIYVPRGTRPDTPPIPPDRVRFQEARPGGSTAPATRPAALRGVEPPAADPVAETVSIIAPKPSRFWKKPFFVVGVVVLLLLGGGVARFWDELFGPRATREAVTLPTPTPTPIPPPAWPAGTDGMTPTEVVAAAPNSAGILLVAKRRMQQGRYDDAIPLLDTAAERNEPEAWFILARLYDPVDFIAGRPFREPSGYDAARHYREAVRRGHAPAAAPRAALRDFLQQRATAGDRDARISLAEFWP